MADLQDFLRRLLHPDAKERATIDELLHHPWMRDHAVVFNPSLSAKAFLKQPQYQHQHQQQHGDKSPPLHYLMQQDDQELGPHRILPEVYSVDGAVADTCDPVHARTYTISVSLLGGGLLCTFGLRCLV